MHAGTNPQPHRTIVERPSDRDVVVTRTVDASARLVFAAFTQAELFRRWWVPASMAATLRACDLDVRVGGTYRLAFDVGAAEPAVFFGTYLEVVPHARLAWTNEDGGADGPITTVTFEDCDGGTRVVLRDRYPSAAALDAVGTGSAEAMVETFAQLDVLLATLQDRAAP